MDFEAYVAARGPALLRFARVLCNDQATAEDLVQAGLADVLAHWERVQTADHPDANLGSYLTLDRYQEIAAETDLDRGSIDPLIPLLGLAAVACFFFAPQRPIFSQKTEPKKPGRPSTKMLRRR